MVLVPSPLLGPAVWESADEALRREQWPTLVVKTPDSVHTAADVLAGLLAAVPADQDVVVVAHSNAGAYLPLLVTRRRLVAAVFVDAILPTATGGPVPLAPPAFLNFLRDKADADGLLPPWTAWWDDADVAPLFPDADTRTRVEQQQPRLPLSYFEGSLTAPPGWDNGPMAYLAFGNTYAAERADAEHRGWPTTTLAGGHLHMLINPTSVALEVTALLSQLGAYPAPPTGE